MTAQRKTAGAKSATTGQPPRKRRSGRRPNLIVILIDDLRFDEVGLCGHPYMKSPHIDRIGLEGVRFDNAFHTTPLCSPNRASIVTGQYASRHGIIDNVARDALSHRLPNYHLILQRLGYDTAHIGKWHMGNSAAPRPGYSHWVSFPGHGSIIDPVLNIDGEERKHTGYVTDLLNRHALDFIARERDGPFALFLAHKAVHPDAVQAADGTLDPGGGGGYLPAERHKDLYRDGYFPPRPNVVDAKTAVRGKPAFTEAFELRETPKGRKVMDWIQSGTQEEIRLRAAMMASVDEGVGQLFDALERSGELDDTLLFFLGDNGYFFGEHALGPERRFAYEEGIRTPFLVRYPRRFTPGRRDSRMVLALDIAPTLVELAGGSVRDRRQMQGLSLLPIGLSAARVPWRRSFMSEYYSENAMPWLHGMTYKAVRTERHKYIHWVQKSLSGIECDELYDLQADPYEMKNLIRSRAHAATVTRLRRELSSLVTSAIGL